MSSLFVEVRSIEVVDSKTLAAYAQQKLGTPIPFTTRECVAVNARLKKFWEANPRATWLHLAQTVDWCVAARRRPATLMGVLSMFGWAMADGAVLLVESTPVDASLERAISRALETETDEYWRRVLIGSVGVERKLIYEAWKVRT